MNKTNVDFGVELQDVSSFEELQQWSRSLYESGLLDQSEHTDMFLTPWSTPDSARLLVDNGEDFIISFGNGECARWNNQQRSWEHVEYVPIDVAVDYDDAEALNEAAYCAEVRVSIEVSVLGKKTEGDVYVEVGVPDYLVETAKAAGNMGEISLWTEGPIDGWLGVWGAWGEFGEYIAEEITNIIDADKLWHAIYED